MTERRAAAPLSVRYEQVRQRTRALVATLSAEDCVAQSMPDASPAKWHLAHTTWFFDTFVPARKVSMRAGDAQRTRYGYLFNSYYEAEGARQPRQARGLLTRPSLQEVFEYRDEVDLRMLEVLSRDPSPEQLEVIELGLHHEQQHQELLLTDVLHLFGQSPLSPRYSEATPSASASLEQRYVQYDGGLVEIGHDGSTFAFDNEGPRHRVYLDPFELAARLVNNAEYREFIDDGGYRRPELWLSDGWAACQRAEWQAPAYFRGTTAEPLQFSLHGELGLDAEAPVRHVSYYEADAFARWAAARLPTEAEWEHAAQASGWAAQFFEAAQLLPVARASLLGSVWVWTSSAYAPYPGFQTVPGALGEYNGKFMCNQMVLRGGSCFTAEGHLRCSYRNFFYPDARWQMSGIRLARSASRGKPS